MHSQDEFPDDNTDEVINTLAKSATVPDSRTRVRKRNRATNRKSGECYQKRIRKSGQSQNFQLRNFQISFCEILKTNNIKWKNWQGEFVLMVTPLCFVHRLKSENHLTRFHSLSLQSRRYLFAFLGQTKHEAGVERETRPTVEGAENFSLCLPCRVCLAIFASFARAFARLNNARN